jgi:transcriptional regulator with XRE-family HTH domain
MNDKSLDSELLRIGATLRAFRKVRRLKICELAEFMAISPSNLSNIEAGRRKLTPAMLARACGALEVEQIAIVSPEFFSSSASTKQESAA